MADYLYPVVTPMKNTAQSLKVEYKGELRRFSLDCSSFAKLVQQFKTILQLGDNFRITYQDEESDWISINSDQELSFAIQLAEKHGFALRLRVTENQTIVAPTPMFNPEVHAPLPVVASPISSPMKTVPPVQTPFTPVGFNGNNHNLRALCEMKIQAKCMKRQAKRELKEARVVDTRKRIHPIRFVKDVTIPDNMECAPGTTFVKVWRVRNEGPSPLPENSKLKFKKGDLMGAPEVVLIKPLQPGEEGDFSIQFVAPNEPGKYAACYKICGPFGRPLGQCLKVKIRVFGSSSEEEDNTKVKGALLEKWSEKLQYLESMGFTNKRQNIKMLAKFNGDLEKVVMKLLKKQMKK